MTVLLRGRRPEDADMLYEVFSDLDSYEQRNPGPPRPLTRESFDRKLAAGDYDADLHLVVEADGIAVGRVTLMGTDLLTRSAEIGIALAASARGQGIGTAAVAQLVEFAFVRHNLRRLHLVAIASNVAGLRAYARAGFVEEGRRREACWVRGAYEDEVLMGLLRADWLSSRP